jgi:hypothetical protein
MGTRGFPDITGFYDMLYGTAGVDFGGMTLMFFRNASGIVLCGNPPYTVTDFLSVYAKFGGPQSTFNGDFTQGSNVVNNVSAPDLVGLATGQLFVNPNFTADALIVDVGSNSFTLSQPSQNTASAQRCVVYKTPFVPIIVIRTFLNLALASVMYQRYAEAWFMAMSLFLAHYCTMFLRTEAGPNLTASQVASSGLTKGIIISRAAGDVSARSQVVAGQEQWGAWTETEYGIQFITLARATNMGPIWVP